MGQSHEGWDGREIEKSFLGKTATAHRTTTTTTTLGNPDGFQKNRFRGEKSHKTWYLKREDVHGKKQRKSEQEGENEGP